MLIIWYANELYTHIWLIDVRIVIQIEQIEEKRDLTQIIVHVDMDAFFAVSALLNLLYNLFNLSKCQNVEVLDNPNLDGKAFAVVRHPLLITFQGLICQTGWKGCIDHCLLRSAKIWSSFWNGGYD